LARSLTIAGAIVASLVAGAACAADGPSLVDGLQHYCVANGNEATAILAKADADGWGPVPDSLIRLLPVGWPAAWARARKDGAAFDVLFAADAHGSADGVGIYPTVCAMLTSAADRAAGTKSEVASWLRLKPKQSDAIITVYTYFDDSNGRHAILDEPDDAQKVKQLAASGKLRVVTVTTSPTMVMVAYIIPKM
jgi:hypothetical protein